MSSINIKFNDEYPQQGHYRSELINIIQAILKEDPNKENQSPMTNQDKSTVNISF